MSWERYSFEDIPSIDGTTARAEEEIARLSLGPEGARIIRTALGKVLQDLRGEDDAPDAPESQDGHTALALPDRVTVRNAGLASVDDWTAGEYPVPATFA
ncbi:MAG: hypothetical protein KC729_16100, partial [Candidatus Eisenbacteria bacterium]|nr:hypothetical protein [Candidatus Eisenbacteria bacterium]